MSETIVTELIVDARGAVKGTAEYEAAMRAAQRAVDSYTAALDKNRAAQAAAAAAGTEPINKLAETSRQLQAAAKSADTYLGRLDPIIFAQNALGAEATKVSTAIKGLDTQFMAGAISVDQLQQRMTLLTGRLTEINGTIAKVGSSMITTTDAMEVLNTEWERSVKVSRQASDGLSDYAARAADVANANRKMADSQLAYNQRAGEGLVGVARSSAAQPISNPLYGAVFDQRQNDLETAFGKGIDNIRASLIPAAAAQQQFKANLDAINEALRVGAINEAEAVAATNAASQAYNKNLAVTEEVTKSNGQLKFATQQLGVQFTQTVSGIAAGQPVFTVLIQQGHQVIDVMLATGTGFRQLGASVAKLFGEIGQGIAAIPLWISGLVAATAAVVGLGVAAELTARQHLELATQLSATRSDYLATAEEVEKAGRRVSASTNASVADATNAAARLAALPIPGGVNASLEDLTRTAAGLASVLGGPLSDAANKVAGALQDPAKAAMAFASAENPLRTMTAATVSAVLALQDAGNKVAASNVLLAALKDAASVAEKQGVTPLQAALRQLDEAFTKTGTDGKSLAKSIGDSITEAAATAVKGIALVIAEIEKLREASKTSPNVSAAERGAVAAAIGGIPMVGPAMVGAMGIGGSALGFTGFGLSNSLANLPPAQAAALARWLQDPRAVTSAVSSSGALGAGQLMPGTAMDLGVNPLVPLENIKGMMLYIQQLSQAFSTPTDIAAHYTTGPAGGGVLSRSGAVYANSALGQDVSKLPSDTAGMIQYWGAVLGMPPEMVTLGMKIAMQENRGQQGPVSIMSRSVGPAGGGTGGMGVTEIPGSGAFGGVVPGGAPSTQQNLAGLQFVRQSQAEVQGLIDKIRELKAAHDAGAVSQADYDKGMAKLNFDLADAKNKTAASVRALQDRAQTTVVLGDAERELLSTQQEIDRQRQADPQNAITEEQATAKLAAVQGLLNAQYTASIAQKNLAIAAQDKLAAAVAGGTLAADKARAAETAFNEARKFFVEGTPAYAAAYKTIYDKTLELSGGLEKIALAQEKVSNQKQIELIKAETEALGMQADAGALYVQHTKDLIAVRAAYAHESPEVQARILAERDAIAASNQQLQQQSSIMQYLAGQADQAFSTIGTAITQAFVQGQGAAVNWGNVMKSVLTQVMQMFLQLAIINPIKQGLLGSSIASAPTLFNVYNTLAGSASDGAVMKDAGGNIIGTLSSGGSVISGGSSLLEMFGLKGLGGQVNSLFGGPGTSLFAGIGKSGIGSSITGALNTQLFTPALSNSAATVGGAIGGIGAGFALGSLAGSYLQGIQNKTGPAPMIGAGIGAAGGFAVGGPAGALVGGLLGGAAGSLIGPRPASAYSSTAIGLADGRLTVGRTLAQRVDASGERAQALQNVDALNAYLDAVGANLTSLGALTQIGQNTPGGFQNPSKFADLASAFSGFRFSSTDPSQQAFLSARGSFASADEFQSMTSAVRAFVSAVGGTDFASHMKDFLAGAAGLSASDFSTKLTNAATFITQTVTALTAPQIGSLATQIQAANAQYADAITMAQQLGYKEAELTAARDKSVQAINAAAAAQLKAAGDTLNNRYMAAWIKNTNADLGVQRDQALKEFDEQAAQQRQQLTDQLVSVYGDAFKGSQAYADQLTMLDKALWQERLAVAQSFDQKIAAAWDNLMQTDQGLNVRIANANAAISGSPTDAQAARLFAFDVQAAQERKTFTDQLKATFGDAYATSQSYADQIALLEKTLGVERLAIQKQYTDAATQTALGGVTSLRNYIVSLQTSSSSPLSPQDQLALARNQFNAVSGAAAAGDYNSLTQLQGYAQTFLDASRAVYGSGATYVDDFTRVLAALSAVANAPADTLTASVLQTETRTQTAQLVDELQQLRSAVDAVTTQLRQNQAAPARLEAA